MTEEEASVVKPGEEKTLPTQEHVRHAGERHREILLDAVPGAVASPSVNIRPRIAAGMSI
jgi:hypothetical protein